MKPPGGSAAGSPGGDEPGKPPEAGLPEGAQGPEGDPANPNAGSTGPNQNSWWKALQAVKFGLPLWAWIAIGAGVLVLISVLACCCCCSKGGSETDTPEDPDL